MEAKRGDDGTATAAMRPEPSRYGLDGLEITDPHHHLWDLGRNSYPWLTGPMEKRICGDYTAIRRNHLAGDFFAAADGLRLVRSVHIEANSDHADPVRETRWLQAVADSPENRGFPQGIVAYCDLSSPDAQETIERHREARNLRGLRQMLHEVMLGRPGESRPLYEDPVWRRNLASLSRHDLSFDLQVYPEQMEEAHGVVAENPDVRFVLCHTGQPANQTPDGLERWRTGMRRLAELPNLALKISGFGMFDRGWTVESIRPIVIEAVAAFGTRRSMFASNDPVDGLARRYCDIWLAYAAVTADFSVDERRRLFSANANAFYRL
ncbi:amidohydrolase family protein [Azospirillum sp. YIM B02556]|uniref:Amidohydrolase family protein n=1 Tax=Azospirillum endophyticum TaxID=2800326 RepID=A0ABS1F8R5_9PROT|nr:amidohydrolase family protein [Azospirillum endophyticum]MBK1839800.1 amidohydrolase family protein [Azospirillum endophyticum]